MMGVMNTITDQPEWDRKVQSSHHCFFLLISNMLQVFDEDITAEWREEIVQSGQDVTPKMMDWIIKELQWKAGIFKERGLVRVFDVGVVKSDTAVSKELQQALKESVNRLENIPEDQKDYHPGSDNKVVNLVNPSLFPVVYGQTRVLANSTIGLDDCVSSVGRGDLIPVPSSENCCLPTEYNDFRSNVAEMKTPVFSEKFQWLPCDVEFTHDTGCRIVSYINNVHPVDHKGLYDVVGKIIARIIPLWDQSLTEFYSYRINYRDVKYGRHTRPMPVWPERDNKNAYKYVEEEIEEFDIENEAEESFWERRWQWEITRPILLPEPEEFAFPGEWRRVNLRNQFPETKLQVIVKLANIELTTNNPEYEGGSWHLEGQLVSDSYPPFSSSFSPLYSSPRTNPNQNERICATAIYYYDSENITESTQGFRQHGMDTMINMRFQYGQHQFLQAVYGFGDDVQGSGRTNVTQNLGGVVCQEGRLLTFPNTVQHRVSPFSLADRSKPGHCKILTLFLVDPHRRVISSANVPPQREDWGGERQQVVNQVLSKLPLELQNMVESDINHPITMDEAKAHRLELMKEHGRKSEIHNYNFEMGNFSLR